MSDDTFLLIYNTLPGNTNNWSHVEPIIFLSNLLLIKKLL